MDHVPSRLKSCSSCVHNKLNVYDNAWSFAQSYIDSEDLQGAFDERKIAESRKKLEAAEEESSKKKKNGRLVLKGGKSVKIYD
ncbi:hypothetical protein GT037_003651 [Alternaria burnsii]|uniref:Uncharacterized protein n=1 Tax=Alternaria burnsii TaxID=1187904 RepID=A0A8H7BA84_9PLEO|nr:uncharacterized protein GT037_003651 [Alternaria burnsii]KAF7678270.1 hypothetical protein GT037_003651 [Alternaria burnsii]